MSAPAINFVWHPTPEGHVMVPRGSYYSRLADSTFTSGNTYRLGLVAEQEQGRTTEQNAKMWAMLNDISEQVDHQGRKYSPDEWKAIFLYACGYQVKFLPDLEGRAFVPYFHSSRKLLKREFIELLEFIQSWAVEHNIKFGDQRADEGGC